MGLKIKKLAVVKKNRSKYPLLIVLCSKTKDNWYLHSSDYPTMLLREAEQAMNYIVPFY